MRGVEEVLYGREVDCSRRALKILARRLLRSQGLDVGAIAIPGVGL